MRAGTRFHPPLASHDVLCARAAGRVPSTTAAPTPPASCPALRPSSVTRRRLRQGPRYYSGRATPRPIPLVGCSGSTPTPGRSQTSSAPFAGRAQLRWLDEHSRPPPRGGRGWHCSPSHTPRRRDVLWNPRLAGARASGGSTSSRPSLRRRGVTWSSRHNHSTRAGPAERTVTRSGAGARDLPLDKAPGYVPLAGLLPFVTCAHIPLRVLRRGRRRALRDAALHQGLQGTPAPVPVGAAPFRSP